MSKYETRRDAILTYSMRDYLREKEKIRKRAVGEIEYFDPDITHLNDGRTMYFVQVKYKVAKRSNKRKQ